MSDHEVPSHGFFYWLSYVFIWPLVGLALLLLGPLRIRGRRNIPRKGPLLVLSNHLADVDPIVVYWSSPRPIHFMAKREVLEIKVVGALAKWFCAFPVERGTPDRKAIRHALNVLKKGYVVGMFPEGQLSDGGHLQPILPGAALIAKMAKVPVICCGLHRTNVIMPYGSVIPRPALGWVTIRWGEVHQFPPNVEVPEIVAWIEDQLGKLTKSEP